MQKITCHLPGKFFLSAYQTCERETPIHMPSRILSHTDETSVHISMAQQNITPAN